MTLWARLADAPRQADTLLHLGDVRYLRGESKEALDAYQHSLDLWTAGDDHAGMASAFCQIAIVNFDTGQQKKAEEQARQCLEIERTLADERGLRPALLIEGELHVTHGQNDAARAEYQEALAAAGAQAIAFLKAISSLICRC